MGGGLGGLGRGLGGGREGEKAYFLACCGLLEMSIDSSLTVVVE